MKYFAALVLAISPAAFADHVYLAQYLPVEYSYVEGKYTSLRTLGVPVSDVHACMKQVMDLVKKDNDAVASGVDTHYLGECIAIANLEAEISPNKSNEHHQKGPTTTDL